MCAGSFVCSESKETEVTPWCLGLMANLCRNNLSLQMFVKGKVSFPVVFCFLLYVLFHAFLCIAASPPIENI